MAVYLDGILAELTVSLLVESMAGMKVVYLDN